ncbi:hypothetical protein [Streptosporangium roseum]|uniref:hypothetical protein n=1 Tax=Streptosporangium roseum TaxID=2001 RepID=UPI00331814C6
MSRTVGAVGGGYGGSAAAEALDPEAGVVLIDPRDAFADSAGSLRALATTLDEGTPARLDEPLPPPAPDGTEPAPDAHAR